MNAYSTLVQCTVRLVKLTRVGIKAGFFNSYYFCYFKFLKTSWSKVRSPQESKKKKTLEIYFMCSSGSYRVSFIHGKNWEQQSCDEVSLI